MKNLSFDITEDSLIDNSVVHQVMPTEVPSASEAECALRVAHVMPTDLMKSSDMNVTFAQVSTSARAGAPAMTTSTIMHV